MSTPETSTSPERGKRLDWPGIRGWTLVILGIFNAGLVLGTGHASVFQGVVWSLIAASQSHLVILWMRRAGAR